MFSTSAAISARRPRRLCELMTSDTRPSGRTGRRSLHELGETPDYRFALANERTFLAWVRTALALMAGCVAVVQFVPGPFVVRHALGFVLITLGGILAAASVSALLLDLAERSLAAMISSVAGLLVAVVLIVIAERRYVWTVARVGVDESLLAAEWFGS